MPQKLSVRWKSDLGEDADELHEKWVHKLGNLTLTSYNPDLSNRPYSEKLEYKDGGFRHSGLNLNEYLKKTDTWTFENIEERHHLLIDRFIEVLPMIRTDYRAPDADKEEEHSLYDEWDQLWGNRICGYILDGIRTDCRDASTTFRKLIEELYARDPETFEAECLNKGKGQFGFYVTDEEGKKTFQIREGMYLRYDFDNENKVRLLKMMVDAMEMDPRSVSLLVHITKQGFHKKKNVAESDAENSDSVDE